MGELIACLRSYFEAPDESINLFAKAGSYAGRKVDGPAAAMHLQEDGYWHFGVAVDVYEESGQFPGHCVGFAMRLKKEGDGFLLHIEESPAFHVLEPTIEHLRPAMDYLYDYVMKRYATTFAEFIGGDGTAPLWLLTLREHTATRC